MTEYPSGSAPVEMDVVKVIRDAWAAVEGADIPESLHTVAFEQAVALIAGQRVAAVPARAASVHESRAQEKATAPRDDNNNESKNRSPVVTDEDGFFATFTSESGVDEEKLRRLYYVKEGRPRIALSKSKLGSTEADRNRSVATLLAGVRWYVEGKKSVAISEIRDSAEAVPYEVSRNLAKHLESVAGTMAVGTKGDKAIRVQTDRFDEPFTALIEKLTAS